MKTSKFLAFLAIISLLLPLIAQAQQTSWIGSATYNGTDSWDNGPWSNGWAPGDTTVFTNSGYSMTPITFNTETVGGIIDTSNVDYYLEGQSLNSSTSTLTVEVDGLSLILLTDVSSIQNIKKTGVGFLQLVENDLGTGNIDIEGGTVQVQTAQALPSGSITDNGTLEFFGYGATITSTLTTAVTGTGGMYIVAGQNYNVVLAGANTYTGTTTVTDANVTLANSVALQDSVLDLENYMTPSQVLFSSTVSSHAFMIAGLNGDSNFALQDNAATPNAVALSIGSNGTATATFTGTITGPGSLTKIGTNTQTLSGGNTFTGGLTVTAGMLVLSGANTYTGGTTISGGVLQMSGTGKLGSTTGTVTMNGGILDLNKTTQTIGALTGSTGTIVNNGGGGATLIVGNGDVSSSYSGVIANHTIGTGAIALTKVGAGTLTLGGANTFNNKVTINDGTISVATLAARSVAQPLGLAGNLFFGGTSAAAPGVLQYTGGSTTMVMNDYVEVGDYGTISNTGGGLLTLSSVEADQGATMNLSGGQFLVNGGYDLEVSENLNVTNGANVTFAVQSLDTGTTTIDGTSSLTVATEGSLNSGTVVDNGSLFLNNTSGSGAGTGSLTVGAGATLGGTGSYGTTGTPGAGYKIVGTGTATGQRANVLVGIASATDTNTTQTLSLIASTATVTNANLTFNLNDEVAGQGTELNVGGTAITFGAGVQSTTLTLNIENTGVIANGTSYVLIAGNTTGGVDQYSGLALGTSTGSLATGLITPILNSGVGQSGDLTLALSGLAETWYGSSSYLFLYQNSTTGADDIEVDVVPEPGTWGLMLGGLVVLVFWRRGRLEKRV